MIIDRVVADVVLIFASHDVWLFRRFRPEPFIL
jgi:hypothetical protein